jgi:ribosome assembly protein SQT1
MQVFAGHSGPVNCGEFTPDGRVNLKPTLHPCDSFPGKRIVSADQEGFLILWDPRSSTPVFKISPDDARFNLDGITSLGVNPSSTLAVGGGAAGGVRVVSLSKGEIIATLAGHTEGESIEAVAFVDLGGSGSSSSGVAVTGATDGKACIWDLSTMRLRASLKHEVVSFSIWSSYRLLILILQDAITALFNHPSPKSHLLISSSADRTLKTWDARSGALIKTHTGHQAAVLGASLGLDGSVIVSAGDDGLCLVFTTEQDEMIS